MKPLNSLILIEYEEPAERKSDGGIYIAPTADNNALGHLRAAKVLAVNPKEEDIKVGDVILFNKLAATKVPKEENKRLVRKEDCYAIL